MSKLPRFTVADILSWGPCGGYKEDILKGWFGRRKYATALMAIDEMRGKIPNNDILWLVLRPECIPEKMLHGLACDFAWKALPFFEKAHPKDTRPRKAIQAKRKWINGKAPAEELAAARTAAWDAAWDAARAAARAAAEAAAEDAARTAAEDAAEDAAEAAAEDAARAAAEAAARDAALAWQVDRVRKVLKKAAAEAEIKPDPLEAALVRLAGKIPHGNLSWHPKSGWYVFDHAKRRVVGDCTPIVDTPSEAVAAAGKEIENPGLESSRKGGCSKWGPKPPK